jgi:hypothetical protein
MTTPRDASLSRLPCAHLPRARLAATPQARGGLDCCQRAPRVAPAPRVSAALPSNLGRVVRAPFSLTRGCYARRHGGRARHQQRGDYPAGPAARGGVRSAPRRTARERAGRPPRARSRCLVWTWRRCPPRLVSIAVRSPAGGTVDTSVAVTALAAAARPGRAHGCRGRSTQEHGWPNDRRRVWRLCMLHLCRWLATRVTHLTTPPLTPPASPTRRASPGPPPRARAWARTR